MAWINTAEDGASIYETRSHRVSVRRAWRDPWMLVSRLYIKDVLYAVSPTSRSATLEYDYGAIFPPGSNAVIEAPPLEIDGFWVKLEVDAEGTSQYAEGSLLWYGRIWQTHDGGLAVMTDKVGDAAPHQIRVGRQTFHCRGLEAELERAIVTSSVVLQRDGTPRRIGRAIAFNRGRGDAREPGIAASPNRAAASPKPWALFADKLDTAQWWNARHIIEYLLGELTSFDTRGVHEIDWQLRNAPEGLLEAIQVPLEAEGRTVRQLIDQLVDRRRLAGWTVDVVPNALPGLVDKVVVDVFSYAPADLTLPSGLLRANPAQVNLDVTTDPTAAGGAVTTSYLAAVQRVRVAGARRSTTATLAALDYTLVADWSNDQRLAYNAGASGDAGYGALSREAKQWANALRRSEAALERVFRWWRMADNLDGLVLDGEGGGAPVACDPVIPRPPAPFIAAAAAAQSFWRPGLRFEKLLALQSDHDYSGNRIALGTVVDNTPTGAEPEYLPPLVLIKSPLPDGSNGYVRLGTPAAAAQAESQHAAGRGWTASVRMQESAAGIIVNVHSSAGPAQHVLASVDFTPRAESECPEIPADLNWQNNLLATVTWLSDHRVEILWPRDLDIPDGEVVREQRIDVGDDFRLDYAPPGTVVDLQAGQLVRTTSGGFFRDDRQRIQELAQIAWEWYRRPRQAVVITWMRVVGYVQLGQMIAQLGPEAFPRDINSVVTSIHIEFDVTAARTTLRTDHAELDVSLLSDTIAHRRHVARGA